MTEERARENVAFTVGMLRQHLTGELFAPAKRDNNQPGGPHCPDEECAWSVCQDGYAWYPCRTPGCMICGAPPISSPEHWAGDVVAHAVMSRSDRASAEAHLLAYPLLRRPNDPPVIPDERVSDVYGDPRDDYDEYDNEPLTAYEMDPDMDDPDLDPALEYDDLDDPDRVDYFSYERGQ